MAGLADLGVLPSWFAVLADRVSRKWIEDRKLSKAESDDLWGPRSNCPNPATEPSYRARPLNGVWATAPYLHNGSVPTVHDLLDSKGRPKVFTRSFRTGIDEYDTTKLGWKVQTLEQPADAAVPAYERRKIYDTMLPGRSNRGHTFGDDLTEAERMAVIEYLKTL